MHGVHCVRKGGHYSIYPRALAANLVRRYRADVVVEGEFIRITDEEMKAAVDQMTELALHVVTAT